MKTQRFFWLMGFSAALLAWLVSLASLASLAFSPSARAQSMLEYTALQTAVAGAAAGDKEGSGQEGEGASSPGGSTLAGQAARQLYGQASGLMAQQGAALSQIGGGATAAPLSAPAGAGKTAFEETKDAQPQSAQESEEIVGQPDVKVFLKNGKVIEGRLLEHADKHVLVEVFGVPVTYFNEDVARIEVIAS